MRKDKVKYLGKNTLIFTISSFGTKFLSFLLVPLYTNVLTTSEYGMVDIMNTTAILMIYIFTINISDAVLRFGLEKKNERVEVLNYGFQVLLKGSVLLGFVMFIVQSVHVFNYSYAFYTFIFSYFFWTALYEILTNFLRAIDKMKEVAIAGIVSSLIMILSNIFGLLIFKTGVFGYLFAQFFGPLVSCVYCLYIINMNVSLKEIFRNSCCLSIKKEMRKYSVPLIFNSISLWINAYLDRYFVVGMCGSDANGLYAVAGKIPTILTTCYTVFTMAWNISAIKDFDSKDSDGFISQTYEVYSSLLVIVCSCIIICNVPLAKILYAKDFFEAWKYSSIMLIYVMFNAFTAFMGSLFSAIKKTRVIAITTVISALVNIVLNIILIPKFEITGAAIATVICYVVMWGIRYFILKNYMDFKINIKRDCVAYFLLIIQVVFEHLDNHFYLGQFCVLFVLSYLYKDLIKYFFELVFKYLRKEKLTL